MKLILAVIILNGIGIYLMNSCSHREQASESCCKAEYDFKSKKYSHHGIWKKKF